MVKQRCHAGGARGLTLQTDIAVLRAEEAVHQRRCNVTHKATSALKDNQHIIRNNSYMSSAAHELNPLTPTVATRVQL